MSKKKIDIYVGPVGGAYIDKTTAQTNYDNAHQNVLDAETTVENANTLKDIILRKVTTSTNVYNEAVTLGIQLESLIALNSSNASKLRRLKEIQSELIANDNDGDYTNGGNKNTAQANLANANAQLQKIDAIIAEAEVLLEDYRKLEITYEIELSASNDDFNQYIVSKESTGSSTSEGNSISDRIDEIESNIDIIDETNTAVQNTTNETINQINSIVNENEPSVPEELVNKYIYIGHTPISESTYNYTVTEDMVTDNIVDSWHILEYNLTKDGYNYFVKGIDSLSTNKTWYIIVPKNIDLTPVKSDMETVDDRFVQRYEVSVNGELYNVYEVSNDVVEIVNGNTSRLNVIFKFAPAPEPVETLAKGYFYVGTELPTVFTNVNDNVVTSGMGWRKIEREFNTYTPSNPLFNSDITLNETALPVTYYAIFPQGFDIVNAINAPVFNSVLDTVTIYGKQYNVYISSAISFIAKVYYHENIPVQNGDLYWYAGKVKPTSQTVIADDLAEDATSTGWHLIPNALSTYNETNPIFNGSTNAIVIDEDYVDVDHFIAIPDGTSIHALLGEPNYTLDSTITIDGNTYKVYASTVQNSEFAYIIY